MSTLRNFIFGNLPQYTRKGRHLHQLLRHSNLRKIVNLLQIEWSLRTGKTYLKCFPYIYIIDPCNACNLRCPLCPTGNQTRQRSTKMMNYECFTSIIDQIRTYAIEVILHNWGESLIHPRIFDMISYANNANIGTNISSHFNNITDRMIDQMIESGLEHLTVSLDGASQEIYEIYRVRGKFDEAISALERLQQRKRETRSPTPIVEWQFIVMKHNEHQIDEAEAMAKRLGVERFRLLSVGLPFEHLENLQLAEQWISNNPRFQGYHPEIMLKRGYLYDEPCFYPYRSITINPDGGVAPCCAVHHEKWDFGNFQMQSLADIWNNKHYQSARSLFSDYPIADPIKTACNGCPLYKQAKHRMSTRM
jgi:radical SAM protein with 4Fe4S-binding SPASM domain